MVLFHFKSMHPFLKVVRHCFGILDGCCTLHRRCCTLLTSILRTAITVGSFGVTGAISSQNEALCEFYGSDGFCRQWIVSYLKKTIRTSIGSWKFFTLRFFVMCI